MFPQIAGQQWGHASGGDRSSSVAGIHDFQSATGILAQPSPAGAKVVYRTVIELRFEVIEGTESRVDCSGYGTTRSTAAIGRQ